MEDVILNEVISEEGQMHTLIPLSCLFMVYKITGQKI